MTIFCFLLSLGWLTPLLARIAEGKQHVVTPVIETIKDDDFTLRGTPAKNIFVGKFNWQLTFDWMPRPSIHDTNDRQALVGPVRWVIFSNAASQPQFLNFIVQIFNASGCIFLI